MLCYLNFENMRDIQGVSKSTDGIIWLCSYGENKIYHIDEFGNKIGNFNILEPSGIANDSKDNTLWILMKKMILFIFLLEKIIMEIAIFIQ